MIFEKGQHYEKQYTVSLPVYEGFVAVFGDKNPMHTDVSFAQAHGFQNKVMHGNILNGFVSHFIGECLPVKSVVIHSQEIQFKNPVYLEDVLKLEARVEEIYESVNTAVLSFKFLKKELVVAKGRIQIGILNPLT